MLKWVWRKKTDEQRKAADEVPRRGSAMAPHQEFKCSLACRTHAEQSGILGFASSHPSQVMHTHSQGSDAELKSFFGKRQKLSVTAVTQRFNGRCSGESDSHPQKKVWILEARRVWVDVKHTFFPADIFLVIKPDPQQQQQQQQCLSRMWYVSLSPCVNTRPPSWFFFSVSCFFFWENGAIEIFSGTVSEWISWVFLKGETLWQFKRCHCGSPASIWLTGLEESSWKQTRLSAAPFCY